MTIADTFQALAAMPTAQRLACCEAALGERDAVLQLAACHALLDRRGLYRPDLVLDHHADLLPEAQREVAARADEFLRLARERIVSGRDGKRLAAYRLVATFGDLASCELLALGVGDVLPEVVDTVLHGLLRRHRELAAAFDDRLTRGGPMMREPGAKSSGFFYSFEAFLNFFLLGAASPPRCFPGIY